MKIAIIGTNGMLSETLTSAFMIQNHQVDVYGLSVPNNYPYSHFFECDLLNNSLDYDYLMLADVIIYASGAGVQAAISTNPSLMYALNLNVPIQITLELKKRAFQGTYISFGSYMEIGLNEKDDYAYDENEIVCSNLSVTNDYALSKRLYSRYVRDFSTNYQFLHFILPNMFSSLDFKPGTRLIPYILQYIQDKKYSANLFEPQFSAGMQKRQFIFLDEIVSVINKSLDNNISSGLYNVGGGEFFSIKDLIHRIFSFYEIECKDSFFGKSIRRDGDIKSLRICGNKLKDAINYLPNKKIEEALLNFKI